MWRLVRSVLMLAVVVALVAGAAQWISRRSAAKETAPPRERPAPLVRTETVDPTNLVEQGSFPGDVRASAVVDIVSR